MDDPARRAGCSAFSFSSRAASSRGDQSFGTAFAVSLAHARARSRGRSEDGVEGPTLMPSVADSQCRHFSQTRPR
jgi:hypothetical protein